MQEVNKVRSVWPSKRTCSRISERFGTGTVAADWMVALGTCEVEVPPRGVPRQRDTEGLRHRRRRRSCDLQPRRGAAELCSDRGFWDELV